MAVVVVASLLELVLELAACKSTDEATNDLMSTKLVATISASRTTGQSTHETPVTLASLSRVSCTVLAVLTVRGGSIGVSRVRVGVVSALLRELLRRSLVVATVRVLVAILSYLLTVLVGSLLAVLEAAMGRRAICSIALILLIGLLVVLLIIVSRLAILLLRSSIAALLGVRA